jgi:hypothetical protein
MLYEPRVGRFGVRDSALKAVSDKFHENGKFRSLIGHTTIFAINQMTLVCD